MHKAKPSEAFSFSNRYRSICEHAARLAEFNWDRCRRSTAAVKVVRPACLLQIQQRTGLSALIMDSVLIVCLWDNGAAEKRISSCSDFHQCSCQTSPFVYTPFTSEALQAWKVLRRRTAAVCPFYGGDAQILHCGKTTTKKHSRAPDFTSECTRVFKVTERWKSLLSSWLNPTWRSV